jgi:hypothetical protein
MEIEDDTNDDVKMDEGYRRYMRLHAIVEEINSNPMSRPVEWYVEHDHLLHVYDRRFKAGFTDIHPEMTDLLFRADCARLDLLINKLMRDFAIYECFSLYEYRDFNKTLIRVVDALPETNDEDDISNIFSDLTI